MQIFFFFLHHFFSFAIVVGYFCMIVSFFLYLGRVLTGRAIYFYDYRKTKGILQECQTSEEVQESS